MFNARLYACNVYVCVCNTCIYVWLRTSTKEISAKSKDSRSRRRTEQCCELIINYFSTQAAERYRRFTPYLFYIFHLSAKTPSLSLSFFLSLSLSLSHSLFLSLSLSICHVQLCISLSHIIFVSYPRDFRIHLFIVDTRCSVAAIFFSKKNGLLWLSKINNEDVHVVTKHLGVISPTLDPSLWSHSSSPFR